MRGDSCQDPVVHLHTDTFLEINILLLRPLSSWMDWQNNESRYTLEATVNPKAATKTQILAKLTNYL